jgi:hypothetical protein
MPYACSYFFAYKVIHINAMILGIVGTDISHINNDRDASMTSRLINKKLDIFINAMMINRTTNSRKIHYKKEV